ncbi:MAG: ribosome biogenesis GTPase Der [Gammaproteobacteria bacterium]|nr:MAG: ribosome biogenesis GTPase Der [Gammaproteobacteria bacterium]
MSMVIALVGRPNVGKSTLFNRLTGSRDSLVSDYAGLTRDRIYGRGRFRQHHFIVIDTGGLTAQDDTINKQLQAQAQMAMEEADIILFLVDGRSGENPDDARIAQRLRRMKKKVCLVVNKLEASDPQIACSEFYRLGLGEPYPLSAAHGTYMDSLLESICAEAGEKKDQHVDEQIDPGIRIALIGRPNVGKSTLVNRLLGEERQVTADQSGTTRDSVAIPFEKDGQHFTLIDTAGIRRRGRISETVEKFSVVKSLQALEACHVALIMLDAQQEVAEQDIRLIGYALEAGRGIVVAVNKWDHLSRDQKNDIERELDRRLDFLDFAPIHQISALHGNGIQDVLQSASRVYEAARQEITTGALNRSLQRALENHAPPMVNGRRPKMRFAYQGGVNPPLFIINGSGMQKVKNSYRRYLEKHFRKEFGLFGTPIKLVFKNTDNPYDPK